MTGIITSVKTDNAPQPAGHYAQAVRHGDVVYVSGQLGFAPGSNDPVVGSIDQQVRNCLANVSAILEAAGSSLDKTLKMTVYVSDVAFWPEVNAVYADVMGDHRPARAIVPCNTLHHGFQVEIDAIAAA